MGVWKKKIQPNPKPTAAAQHWVCVTALLVLLTEHKPHLNLQDMKHSWEFLWLNGVKNSLVLPGTSCVCQGWRSQGKKKKPLLLGTALPVCSAALVFGAEEDEGMKQPEGFLFHKIISRPNTNSISSSKKPPGEPGAG